MHDDKKVAIILWTIGFGFLVPAVVYGLPPFFGFVGMGTLLVGSWRFVRRVLIEHREMIATREDAQ